MRFGIVLLCIFATASPAPAGEATDAVKGPTLVPWPTSVECTGERLSLAVDARIAACTPTLRLATQQRSHLLIPLVMRVE